MISNSGIKTKAALTRWDNMGLFQERLKTRFPDRRNVAHGRNSLEALYAALPY